MRSFVLALCLFAISARLACYEHRNRNTHVVFALQAPRSGWSTQASIRSTVFPLSIPSPRRLAARFDSLDQWNEDESDSQALNSALDGPPNPSLASNVPFSDIDNAKIGKSLMDDYVSAFLRRDEQLREDRNATTHSPSAQESAPYTHLIAIPVDSCHELMLELESVQRAILYHCPILVHACIVPAVTRLPLFYVKTSTDVLDADAVATLTRIVDRVVRELIFERLDYPLQNEIPEDGSSMNLTSSVSPLTLTFSNLEIDGVGNQVLSTVARPDDPNTSLLIGLTDELRRRIQLETGWSTALANQGDRKENSNTISSFRPRIPFMRLPLDWDAIIEDAYHEESGFELDNNNGDDENDRTPFLTSDKGGNGISPIFWIQWLEDTFAAARMPEIGVYSWSSQRIDLMPSSRTEISSTTNDNEFRERRLDENSFYHPRQTVLLPSADPTTAKVELRYRKYQLDRISEAEETKRRVKDGVDTTRSKPDVPPDDLLLSKTRSRLEDLYRSSSEDLPVDVLPDSAPTNREDDAIALLDSTIPVIDDTVSRKMLDLTSNRASQKAQLNLGGGKSNLTTIQDNPVFLNYKKTVINDGDVEPAGELTGLRRFSPGRDDCVGIWQMIRSPTGFDVEEGDSSRNDNLILRVDGTIAGGPILDQETRQKASGGTWSIRSSGESTSLSIRLVIPPRKERILFMQGPVERISPSAGLSLASSTFQIPEIQRKSDSSKQKDEFISCNGRVWIEDAVTRLNKEEIGSFSLKQLLNAVKPTDYTITIPRSIRNQD
jgi:hypothetical protein